MQRVFAPPAAPGQPASSASPDPAELLARYHPLVVTERRGRALQDLLRRTNLTVWYEARCARPVRRVLVALDPSTSSRVLGRILDVGTLLADVTGAELFAVHAWDAPGERLIRFHCSRESAEEYVHSQSAEARTLLEQRLELAHTRIDQAHRSCSRGDACSVITRAVGELQIDALVLGMSRRTPLARALLGCTAVRLAEAVSCHVIIIPSAEAMTGRGSLPRAVAIRRAA